ncbi:molecular chaperone [Pantoea sp. SOD02]|uniref:fimbrial biogenesis chaperone n=1 Tax=Pantoea sp. SOD02 TaxID=2970818 RepID=UPI002157D479|nr:molecular chaperone [Pantoea sp. SOD02]UVC28086.1 molecular chaperone [Pantoea sp. SOD02]
MKFASLVMTTLIPFLVLSANSAFAENSKGGFSLGSTRLIFQEKDKAATLTVLNTAKNSPFLAQSWLTNYESSQLPAKPPFVITPPLYRQDAGQNTLRIMKTAGELPTDRESAYWFNVKAVPAQAKDAEDSNKLSFAYVLRIKMFYRPDGISGDAQSAYKQLTFAKSGNNLVVTNPTAYYVTFNKVSVDGRDVNDVSMMVPPKGQQNYSLPAGTTGSKVEYRTINDMGGLTPAESKSLAK